MSALGVVASGPAADAIAAHVPALAEERFASRLFEQDATLWGPDAESEAAVRLSWVGLPRSSRYTRPMARCRCAGGRGSCR